MLDARERAAGDVAHPPRPRVKLVRIAEMLEAARSLAR